MESAWVKTPNFACLKSITLLKNIQLIADEEKRCGLLPRVGEDADLGGLVFWGVRGGMMGLIFKACRGSRKGVFLGVLKMLFKSTALNLTKQPERGLKRG